MTSQSNLEDIYTELNNLLKDVCSFLTTEAQNGTLSAKAKNEAEKLVSRSRQQVEIVTKLSVIQESTNSNYPYLEMLPGRGFEDPLCVYVAADSDELEHYEESYPLVDNEPISSPPPTSTVIEDFCLYADLPLCMIEEKSVKYGPLFRKERYLFIEQKKQYMMGLVGYWLLIYALNKREQKPLQIINLLNYSARSIEQRKDPAFEICAENEKTYEFIARSIKDMEQWVVAINCKKHICTNGRNLPEIPLVTISQEFDNWDRNSNQNNSDSQNVPNESDEEVIYESVPDFGKPEIPKQLPTPITEEFPKLPPRSTKELSIPPKISIVDNTYNNLPKPETEVNDDDTNSEYDLVQCPDTQKNNEEEQLEIYDELKVIETVNKNVRKPSFSNANTTFNNYDSVDTEQEDLEDYDTVKPSKIPIKINVPQNNNVQEDEDMVDYDELKPIYQPNNFKHTLNKTQLRKDEELENYDELKPMPCKSNQPTAQVTSEEVLEDYDVLKPAPQNYKSKQNKPMHSTTTPKDEELKDDDVNLIPQSSQNKFNVEVHITPPEDEELVDYDELKPFPNTKPSELKDTTEEKFEVYDKPNNAPKSNKQTENMAKKLENSNETKTVKPSKPMKKFWEKRISESSKKESDTEDDESKRSVASIKSKFNVQLSAQDKGKPPIMSPKPKSQMLLNKFPSFSKNKNNKDEDGNSKVQNIRQQLEHTLSFRSNK